MILNKVNGCCSMATISNNPAISMSKKYFKLCLKMAIEDSRSKAKEKNDHNFITPYKINTLVMITNLTFFERLKYRKLGFRKAYTYRGYDGCKAHVMYLNLKDSLEEYISK
jgi:hypothetical protein